MSTVETKPVRLNWIHVDDDLSYVGHECSYLDMIDLSHVLIGGEYVEGNASYRWDRKKINAV